MGRHVVLKNWCCGDILVYFALKHLLFSSKSLIINNMSLKSYLQQYVRGNKSKWKYLETFSHDVIAYQLQKFQAKALPPPRAHAAGKAEALPYLPLHCLTRGLLGGYSILWTVMTVCCYCSCDAILSAECLITRDAHGAFHWVKTVH